MTNLTFGPLSYGAASLGNLYRALSDEEAEETLSAAWDCGVRHFDTAPHYGLGLSERRLGAFLAGKPRDEFTISTKAGRLLVPNPDADAVAAGATDLAHDFDVPAAVVRSPDFTESGIRRSLEESLGRLGLDFVDVLYLHDPERYGLEESLATGLPAVVALREEGLVSAVGIGSMSVEALLRGVTEGDLDLIMVAGRYTLLEQPALPELLPACLERGVGVVNAAVFNTGLLAASVVAEDARYEYGPVPPALLERARMLAATCAEFGVELPAAALRYTLRHPAVRTVVVGGGRAQYIRQNAERMATAIPDELWQTLRERGLIP
ncbi:aldo/keto reductase [Luethyella okanaganae]|uniref:Aldo/keto reductase n=1 Tax=Luethyella okanaganae TaxID=69372 RepID=A0ABW1VKL6_9MICO